MAGLINLAGGLAAAGGALSKWGSDMGLQKMKLDAENQQLQLESDMIANRQREQWARENSPEADEAAARRTKSNRAATLRAEAETAADPDYQNQRHVAAIADAQDDALKIAEDLKTKSTPEALAMAADIARAGRESPAEAGQTEAARERARAPFVEKAEAAREARETARQEAKDARDSVRLDNQKHRDLGDLYGVGEPNPDAPGVENAPPLTGAEFLRTLPKKVADEVQGYADGLRPMPSAQALRSPYGIKLMGLITQYDPSFDATNYPVRLATRKSFEGGGKNATTIGNLNTAIGHAGTLLTQIGGTSSLSGFPFATLANRAVNDYNTMAGKKGVPIFRDTVGKLAEELTLAYRGSAGAEGDVTRALKNMSENDSEETKVGVLINAIDLLDSKIGAMGELYNQGMGTSKAPLELLQPHAKQVMKVLQAVRDTGAIPKDLSALKGDRAVTGAGTPITGAPLPTGPHGEAMHTDGQGKYMYFDIVTKRWTEHAL